MTSRICCSLLLALSILGGCAVERPRAYIELPPFQEHTFFENEARILAKKGREFQLSASEIKALDKLEFIISEEGEALRRRIIRRYQKEMHTGYSEDVRSHLTDAIEGFLDKPLRGAVRRIPVDPTGKSQLDYRLAILIARIRNLKESNPVIPSKYQNFSADSFTALKKNAELWPRTDNPTAKKQEFFGKLLANYWQWIVLNRCAQFIYLDEISSINSPFPTPIWGSPRHRQHLSELFGFLSDPKLFKQNWSSRLLVLGSARRAGERLTISVSSSLRSLKKATIQFGEKPVKVFDFSPQEVSFLIPERQSGLGLRITILQEGWPDTKFDFRYIEEGSNR